MTEHWHPLSRILTLLGRLDHPLYQSLAHDDYPREYRLLAIESALRSGAIPMRGCRVTALGLEATERIELKIDDETAIDIPLDEITLRKAYPEAAARLEYAVFKCVEADLDSVEKWLRKKASPTVWAAVRDAAVLAFLRDAECSSSDKAWDLVKTKFGGGITQARVRKLWKNEELGGHLGRPKIREKVSPRNSRN